MKTFTSIIPSLPHEKVTLQAPLTMITSNIKSSGTIESFHTDVSTRANEVANNVDMPVEKERGRHAFGIEKKKRFKVKNKNHRTLNTTHDIQHA